MNHNFTKIKDLRIFYASHKTGNGTLGSLTWYHNLFFPLKDISQEIIESNQNFDFHLLKVYQLKKEGNLSQLQVEKKKMAVELLKEVKEAKKNKNINVLFTYLWNDLINESFFDEVRNLNIISVNFFCNASYQFHLVDKIAPKVDFCLVPEPVRLINYKNIGANPLYCPMSANPNFYQPDNSISKMHDIAFVGTRYADRYKYIKKAFQVSHNIKVAGKGWEQKEMNATKKFINNLSLKFTGKGRLPSRLFLGLIDDKKMFQLLNASQIILGFTKVWTNNLENTIHQVRLREFEVAMLKCFYVCERNEFISEFYEEDKEIILFDSDDEFSDKLKFYLNNPSLRLQVANNFYERALKEHTSQSRFSEVFKKIL